MASVRRQRAPPVQCGAQRLPAAPRAHDPRTGGTPVTTVFTVLGAWLTLSVVSSLGFARFLMSVDVSGRSRGSRMTLARRAVFLGVLTVMPFIVARPASAATPMEELRVG